MVIPISKGKEVVFQMGGGPISGTENATMLLNEDLTLNFSSSFSEVASSSSPTAFKLLAGVLRDSGASELAGLVGGEFKQLGFKVWTGTEPLTTTLSLKFAMTNNAKTEVVDPVIALTKLALPTVGSLGSLIGPGPSIVNAFKDDDGSYSDYKNIHCYIGNFKISNIIITRAIPTFSKHTDQNGYPIWASLEISFSTIFSATVEMLDSMIGGSST